MSAVQCACIGGGLMIARVGGLAAPPTCASVQKYFSKAYPAVGILFLCCSLKMLKNLDWKRRDFRRVIKKPYVARPHSERRVHKITLFFCRYDVLTAKEQGTVNYQRH